MKSTLVIYFSNMIFVICFVFFSQKMPHEISHIPLFFFPKKSKKKKKSKKIHHLACNVMSDDIDIYLICKLKQKLMLISNENTKLNSN